MAGKRVNYDSTGGRPGKSVDELLDVNPEAEDDTVEEAPRRPDPRDKRISKHVRMRIRFADALFEQAYKETMAQGRKVSEADLLDEILTEGMKKRGWV